MIRTFFIERVESRQRQINFAAHFHLGNAFASGFQLERNLLYGFEIGGDVFADDSIAASRTPDEAAVLISKRDRNSVYL